jgi:hypothetical protein
MVCKVKIMSWENILKGGKRRSERAIELVDELMSDGKSRVIKDILKGLWAKIEEKNRENPKYDLTGSLMIPTTRELGHYLSRSDKYESDVYDGITDKILTGRKREPHHVRKYRMKK